MNETVQDPEFHLAPELKRDTLALGELPLCRILLMNDKHFPWIILVPRRAGASEMFDLCDRDQHQLMREIAATGRALQTVYQPTKVNIGALGNIVRQLHIHVIARFEGDAAWPGPVWGALKAQAYPGSAPGYADVVGQRILEAILIAYRAD
ncbi:MAG: HIT domain-containing protein [Rhizobiales bacterium]|nr:HIT domain-containing protein [Hyphomicrobiales bacterium]